MCPVENLKVVQSGPLLNNPVQFWARLIEAESLLALGFNPYKGRAEES